MNTMTAGTDRFQFRKQALLIAKSPLDFTYDTSVAGFNISGTEPQDCSRRVIFELDGKLYKFGNSGLTEYEWRGELADILAHGNTVAELLEVKAVPEFAGKMVYIRAALDAPADSPVMPRLKISANVNSYNDLYAKTEFSPVYQLAPNAKIADVVADKFLNGHATATIFCRLFDAVNQSWGDWIYTPAAKNKVAAKIQFKIDYVLTTLDGSDFARVNSIRTNFTTDADKINAAAQNIIALPIDFSAVLNTCYLLIKHSELIDSQLRAFVNFSKSPVRRENLLLGTTTGNAQTLYLQSGGVIDRNVAQDSIHLDVGGKTFSDFDFDTEKSTVTLTAPAGSEIFASYDAGLDTESWQEMSLDYLENAGDFFTSRFIYRGAGGQVSAVKIAAERFGGTVDGALIGKGTGKLQTFALPHRAFNLDCNAAFKYENQIMKVVAPIDADISAGYIWRGELPTIYEYIAGWTV